MNLPRILIAGLRGGGGKTLLSLGLAAAWRNQGRRVAPFKKGPDYIDAAWLSMAAGGPCRNLDLFLMTPATVVQSLATTITAGRADVAVIEGNRGLFDGMDAQGSYSSAELAKLLGVPVLLTVDCTKSTRTIAALVLGCQKLDPRVPIRGVVLNRTAGDRHESVLREAVESICGLPVLGAIPRLRERLFPERHLGLIPPDEHDRQLASIERAADAIEQSVDLDALWDVARQAPAMELHDPSLASIPTASVPITSQDAPKPERVCIGILRDSAFQFYYPENLEALAREGARLTEISPLRDAKLPEVDALYIGGGFPETLATELARNRSFLDSLRERVEHGLPVYAECGGAVFLGEKLVIDQNEYPMAAVLPVSFAFQKRPQGHGYVKLETIGQNPFFPVGQSVRGHEFHYTRIDLPVPESLTFAFRVRRGYGFDGQRDGLCRGNVLASYTHVHALGTERWAPSMVQAAVRFKGLKTTKQGNQSRGRTITKKDA